MNPLFSRFAAPFYSDDLEPILDDALVQGFNTEAEDGSILEVRRLKERLISTSDWTLGKEFVVGVVDSETLRGSCHVPIDRKSAPRSEASS